MMIVNINPSELPISIRRIYKDRRHIITASVDTKIKTYGIYYENGWSQSRYKDIWHYDINHWVSTSWENRK